MNKIKSLIFESTFNDLFYIIICLFPIWFFENITSSSKLIIIYLTLATGFCVATLFLIKRIKKSGLKKKMLSIFFAIIFFYGVDSKLGLWQLFENSIEHGVLRYVLSLFILLFIVYILTKLLLKNFLITKKIFTIIIFFILTSNLIFNYHLNSKLQKIETFNISNQIKNINKKKIIILFLDEMIGFNGIDENIEYGKLAKKSYLNLAKKYDLNLFASAYSIYPDTAEAIPTMLNYDFQTTKNNTSKYFVESLIDKKTKWKLKKNTFFMQNKNKKIISNKNQAISYCDNYVEKCIGSVAINNYEKYLEEFIFSENDYFIKQMHNQKSIFFQYFWRMLLAVEKLNDYHNLVFNKVKFKNDMDNLKKLILRTNYDIYLSHFLFPHRPFGFDIAKDNKNCVFDKKIIEISISENKKEILNQHYKEIICTNLYLDSFLSDIINKQNLNNIKIFIISDTGLKVEEDNYSQYDIKNLHSVFFAVYDKNKKFNLNNEFVSSQELFSKYFDLSYKNSSSQLTSEVFSFQKEDFVKIDKF
jgi:hypothetical protein